MTGQPTNDLPRALSLLALLARGSLVLPLLVGGCLYGEWLLAGWALGHPPRPSLDDPAGIAGSSWMHWITTLALMGAIPAALASLALNVLDGCLFRPRFARTAFVVAVLLTTWIGLFALLRADPGRVVAWWCD